MESSLDLKSAVREWEFIGSGRGLILVVHMAQL